MRRFSGAGSHGSFRRRSRRTHPLNLAQVRRGGIRL